MHGAGDNMTAAIRNDGFMGTATQEHDGCDHTSTKKRPFLGLAGYHSCLPLVVPMGSALPIAIGSRRSSIRSPDRKIRAVEIARLGFFPVFCRVEDPIVRGRSAETTGFLDSRG